MMKTGSLIISNPNIIFRVLPLIQNEISNTLYIQYFPTTRWNRNLTLKNTNSNTQNWPNYSSSIMNIYSKVLLHKNLDVRVLLSGVRNNNHSRVITKKPVEVVYYERLFNKEDVRQYISNCFENKTEDCQLIPLPNEADDSNSDINDFSKHNIYENVVLGGTFDRLHYGHKILLSEAILHCHKKVTIGVTDTNMLQGKKLWELVEPCSFRIQKVQEFLDEVYPSLEYDVIPINDMFGPTKDDPTFQMIVVSSETVRGGSKVNELREANGLDPLCIHQVELLADINKEDEEEEDKISSSNLRLRCLGSLLRPPQANPNIPEKPYVIGLAGGIASGKSNIMTYLEELGAGVVYCDQLAHYVYRPGSPGLDKVVEQFGKEILDQDGAVDRKKLGAIVFSDKSKLEQLNKVVWPLILEETQKRIVQLGAEGHPIVVLEAAVLLRAGWTSHCHELWVSIIPPEEAVKRVMERNGLSEVEAKSRIASQPTNMEYVQQANVVFSSLWRKEFTQKQVNKAWLNLKERLNLQ